MPADLRIASLLASGTEILFALGLGEHVVAVSHECDFPPQVRELPRVTSTRIAVGAGSSSIDRQVQAAVTDGQPLYDLDVAALVGLRPNLIVTQAQCDVCAVRYDDVLAATAQGPLAGARVIALNPRRLEDVYADIARVARAAGCPEAGEELIAGLRRRVAAVRQATAPAAAQHRPRLACIEWLDPLMVAGNWMPELIEIAGAEQRLTEAGLHSPYVSWEQIHAYNPEVVVLMPCGFDLARTMEESGLLTNLPGWHETAAARQGRVFAVDGNAYFNRAGPRLVDSLEILAYLIHPQAVSAPPASVWRRL